MRGMATLGLTGLLVLLAGCPEAPPPPVPSPPIAERPTPPPPPPPVEPPDAGQPEPEPTAVIIARIGKVEVRRGNRAAWDEAHEGDKVGASDSVRTAEGGRLELQVGAVKIRIHEASELKVKGISGQTVRAQFKGRLESEVKAGAGVVELEAEGSDAVARSEGGRFSISSDGKGVVAVASVAGAVKLRTAGGSVNVDEGEVSHVRPGQAPDAPSAALRNVLLSVNWPAGETNQRQLPVGGEVELGTRVLVQGKPVDVDARGRFRADVRLRQGKQRIEVVAVDVLGRQRSLGSSVVMDETLPDARLKESPWRQQR